MKTIGIIGAMDEEITFFKNHLNNLKTIKKARKNFYSGKMKGKNIIVVESGIGKVNAAVSCQVLIDLFNVESVLGCGVAGGIHPDLEFGDIVISKDLIQYDIDVTCFGYELGFIPRLKIKEIEADTGLVKLAKSIGDREIKDNRVFVGRILTGDRFVSDPKTLEKLREDFKGWCVEMESAAIAQTCFLNNIPFVIIRSISDKADSCASLDYKKFAEKAAENSFTLISKMLDYI
ncbi:MAG: adenosylhomocysteine nucleosidase [Thermosediminibacterales bacterium]|nr:adenosylhomocysteine nucleosidase [Thermosediminibacterales bacterium]MDK2836079.1 adenosylhomocysteine nucleosidase [Thermosediminibacterales bacterium]